MWNKVVKAVSLLTLSVIALQVGAGFASAQEKRSSSAVDNPKSNQVSGQAKNVSKAGDIDVLPTGSDVSGSKAGNSVYETLGGWLTIGTSGDEVQEHLGPPEKGEPVLWGALGAYVQQWRFPDQGVALRMEVKGKGGPANVLTLKVDRPSAMKTSKGIGVGDLESSVLKRYKEQLNQDWSHRGKSLVVGSIYGGTIFTIADGRVTGIFVGAAAE